MKGNKDENVQRYVVRGRNDKIITQKKEDRGFSTLINYYIKKIFLTSTFNILL
jgi:hypothetical protein